MRRAVLMAVATISLFGGNAIADNFTFSFTQVGIGTVTGEMFGLQDNATSKATEVLITSYPEAFLGSIQDLVATDWQVLGNSFTETNGVITGGEFAARNPVNDPIAPDLDIKLLEGLLSTNFGSREVAGSITFTPAPVPEPFAWTLLLTVMLAVAIVKRRRRTDGLAVPATRMRSR